VATSNGYWRELNPSLANPERHFWRYFWTATLPCLIALCALSSANVLACEPWSQDAADNPELRVGSIQIKVNDVFNNQIAAENRTIHRVANQLHIQSKKELIKAQLLFSYADPFDADLLAETARNLRKNSYLRSATVTPVQICDGEVDILVETDDNWSLIPSFNFSREGGENQYTVSLSELNLFGRGKSLRLGLDYSSVRERRVLLYQDPMLFGSKTQFSAQLQNNTDGEVQVFDFYQPFASLDSRSSWRASVGNSEYVQTLYDNGQVVNQLDVDQETATVSFGISKGRQFVRRHANGRNVSRVFRWRAGWSYNRLQLNATTRFPDSMPVPKRVHSYPFIDLNFLQPDFIKLSNLTVMESIEDIDVGHQLRTRIGWASNSFGSNTDALIATTDYAKGWRGGKRFLGLLDAGLEGYATDEGIENAIAKATFQGYYFASRRNRFFALTNLITTQKLFEHRQVVLGGATGLRGYPLNYQTGSRRAPAFGARWHGHIRRRRLGMGQRRRPALVGRCWCGISHCGYSPGRLSGSAH